MSQDEVGHGGELPGAGAAGRVIEGQDEVGRGGGLDAEEDDVPGRQQVAQADARPVVGQRRPQPRGGRQGGRHAGHDDDLGGRSLPRGQFAGDAPHAVDPGVAAGDQGDGAALRGPPQGDSGPLDLLAQLAADDLLAAQEVGDRVQITAVADDRLGPFQGGRGVGRQQAGGARS
jgi:hypothetical protein